MNENPIFILGAHKSGTSLMRSLLDGHNELSVIPFESHFLELLGFWIENPTRINVPENVDEFDFVDKAMEFARQFNIKDNPYGDVVLSKKMNIDKFRRNLKKRSPISDDSRIQAYLESIQVSLDQKLGKRIVEKSVENFEYAAYLANQFPDAKFIHIVRNPYSNLVALRKFKQKALKQYPRLDRVVETIRLSFYYAVKNQRIIDDYKIIRYEDLIERPIEVMKSISYFLKIEYNESLLMPSSQGEIWTGNSTSGKVMRGISKMNKDSWKKSIKPIEVEAINRKLDHIFSLYKYQRVQSRGNLWKRCKQESVKKYLGNRLYLYQ